MNIIPIDFDWKTYIEINNDLDKNSNEEDTKQHYLNYGIFENRQYKKDNLPLDFDWNVYLKLNPDLDKNSNEENTKQHYLNYGIFENRKYKNNLPLDFDWNVYLKLNQDLDKNSNEEDTKQHYLNYGIFENRQYNYNFNIIKQCDIFNNISMSLDKYKNIDYCENNFINEYEIKENLPRCQHNCKEKINISVLNTFILIVDFHNGGGGTTTFIESIISKYKKYQTFLIVRNFNDNVYFTVNDDYELETLYNNDDAYKLLLDNKNKIEKIFINHIYKHSTEFINNLFNLNIKITTITHDLLLLFNKPQISFNDIDSFLNDKTKKSFIDINKYDQIITQNKANVCFYNYFIEDKNKIVVSPLPDVKKSKDLIETANDTIIIGIIGAISDIKGKIELIKIINFYKNANNIQIIVFGFVNIESFINFYPYKNINQLNELLITHKPNIIIELSIWPETYCYTLTLAMVTQLPILYFKKNNYCAVEERLSTYNKAYSFTNIKELNKLIYDKKQDYFYTIEPIIYFNDFWDSYFIKNQIIEEDKINNYINKNLVLITSKIIVSDKPFSYVDKRSIYTKEQRFIQTLNTIESIRKYIPDSYIVLIDNSLFNSSEYNTLFLLTDYFINITDDKELNYYTDECAIKMLSDLMQQLCFYENFVKKYNINNIRNFFKISGRYFINENFNYKNFDNDYTIFKKNIEILDRDYYYTSFYKINSTKFLEYFDILKSIKKEEEKYSINTVNDFETFLPNKINDKKVIDCLGITQLISVWNEISEI